MNTDLAAGEGLEFALTADASKRVVAIGQGFVGLPVSMRAFEVGYDVVGYDVGKRKIGGRNNGESHIDDITGPDEDS